MEVGVVAADDHGEISQHCLTVLPQFLASETAEWHGEAVLDAEPDGLVGAARQDDFRPATAEGGEEIAQGGLVLGRQKRVNGRALDAPHRLEVVPDQHDRVFAERPEQGR